MLVGEEVRILASLGFWNPYNKDFKPIFQKKNNPFKLVMFINYQDK